MWFYPDLCLKPLLESGFKTLPFRRPDSLVSCRKADSCKKSMRFQKYPDSSGRCLTICVTTISFLCIMFGFTIHTNTLLRFPIANYQLAMIYWNCSKNSIQVNRRLFSGCCPLFHFKIQFSKISDFSRLHEFAKTVGYKNKNLLWRAILKRRGFGDRIHWFRVDGRPIHV